MNFSGRHQLRHYIQGDGIEVGALHNSFDITGLPITSIRYVDRLPEKELRAQYPELKEDAFVSIDVIDDGQVLGTIANESLDFIIANHFIEHCDNPLGTFENWCAKLRPSGVMFMAVPDQQKGWDERREVTPLAHMVEDYRSNAGQRKERNYQHFKDWTELVGNIHDEAHVSWLIDIDYSIHFHVFTFDSFRALLGYAQQEMALPFELVDAVAPSKSSWESVFVLRKTGVHSGINRRNVIG